MSRSDVTIFPSHVSPLVTFPIKFQITLYSVTLIPCHASDLASMSRFHVKLPCHPSMSRFHVTLPCHASMSRTP
eukprot:344107-Amorphochlora_amoeboformis.AAC.1